MSVFRHAFLHTLEDRFGSTAERVETGARKSYTHKEVARGGAGTNEPECDNTID